MLSRTADNLYWLARYMERADFLARIVDVTRRLSALPSSYAENGTEWDSALEASGAAEGFHATGEPINEENVVELPDLLAG